MNENEIDKVYIKLIKKGKAQTEDLFYLTEKQVTPEIRRLVSAGICRGPKETFNFYLKSKADVTGIPTDIGWILKDKRINNAKRGFVKA